MNAYNKVDIYIGAWYGLYHYDKSYSLRNDSHVDSSQLKLNLSCELSTWLHAIMHPLRVYTATI